MSYHEIERAFKSHAFMLITHPGVPLDCFHLHHTFVLSIEGKSDLVVTDSFEEMEREMKRLSSLYLEQKIAFAHDTFLGKMRQSTQF